MPFIIKNYDTSKYNFQSLVSNCFEVKDLQNLHVDKKNLLPKEKLKFENESKTNFHNLFYKKLNDDWEEIKESYENFISEEVSKNFNQNFVYQAFPTFRIHIPNDQAINYWHYDSDQDHRHPHWEINFQLAITDMFDSNCTWIESVPGLKDFQPMNLKYGQYSIFDGNRCMHGNKLNKTGKTRISLDFRVMPYDRYDEMIKSKRIKSSATTNRDFVIGQYYKFFGDN